jgi:hypothetical protein
MTEMGLGSMLHLGGSQDGDFLQTFMSFGLTEGRYEGLLQL